MRTRFDAQAGALRKLVPPHQRMADPDRHDSSGDTLLVWLRWGFWRGLPVAICFALIRLGGCGIVSDDDIRLATLARSAVPNPRRWTDEETRLRLSVRAEAVSLVHTALSVPVEKGKLTWLAQLSGVDETLIEPRRAQALLFIASQLQDYSEDDRVKILNRIIIVSHGLNDSDALASVEMIVRLPAEKRRWLFASDGSLLAQYIAAAQHLEGDMRDRHFENLFFAEEKQIVSQERAQLAASRASIRTQFLKIRADSEVNENLRKNSIHAMQLSMRKSKIK